MGSLKKEILPIVRLALKEDIGRGDISSQLVIPSNKKIRAAISVKEEGIVCGLDVSRLVFKTADRSISWRTKTKDGRRVKKGEILAYLEGNARSILKAERTALNFLSRLSGIATLTAKYIQKVRPYPVKIMDTRKTAPGMRILEKYAVCCAGGLNHRMGLWDQVLIKDNHLAVVGIRLLAKGLKELVREIKKSKAKETKVEIEVKNLCQFKQALKTDADIIMLDNFNLKEITKAVRIRNTLKTTNYKLPKLEVSGGVNLHTVRRIAACGVEMISVGELTHSAKALDITLNCE